MAEIKSQTENDLSTIVKNLEEGFNDSKLSIRKTQMNRIKKIKRKGTVMSIPIPNQGAIDYCKISKWHFEVGDTILQGDVLCILDYDKCTIELCSEYNCNLISVTEINKSLNSGTEMCKIEKY